MRLTVRACIAGYVFSSSMLLASACSDPATSAIDAMDEEFSPLISSSWTIPPGEQYQCERLTVAEDTWIRSFSGTTPLGSHHSVLTVETNPTQADGRTVCNAGENYTTMIYGLGVGTNAIDMPEGVAMRVPAGSQLLLNLHLFNTQAGGDLVGTSDILIRKVAPEDIDSVIEAEVVLMGPPQFTIDPGVQDIEGGCTMNGDATLFMVNPHMHQLGIHMKVVAERASGGDVEMHDGPYSFQEQTIYPIDPVEVQQGDRVAVTCTYDNDTGLPVMWGDSSEAEMCFATTYRYPKLGSSFGIVCPF